MTDPAVPSSDKLNERKTPLGPLIHIGAAKAASSWLQTEVFRNGQLGFEELATRRDQKSVLVNPPTSAFDAVDAMAFFAPYVRAVAGNGTYPVVSLEALSGTSRFGDQNAIELADRLHAVFPDGRALYILREQSSMWRAQYLQYVRRGGHRSIGWFLDQNGQDKEGSAYFRWNRFQYDGLIRHYQRLFGREQVLVLPLEMLASAPQSFSGRIMAFCGLSAESPQNFPAAPPQRKSSSQLAYAMIRWLNPLFAASRIFSSDPAQSSMGAKAKLRAAAGWADQTLPVNWKRRYQHRTDQLIAQRLGDYYAISNSSVERATGLDLAPFGYALDR